MGGAFKGADGEYSDDSKGAKGVDALGKGIQNGLEARQNEQDRIRANARPVNFQIDQGPQLPGDFFQQSGYLNNAMQRWAPQNQQQRGQFNPFYGG